MNRLPLQPKAADAAPAGRASTVRPPLRRRLYLQLDPRAWPKPGLSPLNTLVTAAIIVATAAAIAETEPLVTTGRERLFEALELGFGIFFLAEYAGRLWTVVEDRGSRPAWRCRLAFVRSPAAIFDLLAILSALLPFVGASGAMLRLVRLLRIFRLAKLGRMSAALRNLSSAVASRRFELAATVGLALMLVVFGATALYWIEGEIQPDKFGSIPRALWWAVVTLTTIGYGDLFPVTPLGKLVAAFVAVAGIGLIAMPTGILASAFSEASQRAKAG
ncbi:MAG TPA: ion transporter [Allosphingosinicella sp.]|nr:ion transporter [Allosphingosinicella sp.]